MYFTVGSEGCAELSVKHSKFLAFCARVTDEDEAETFVRGIKKKYSDATHAPYAYILGDRGDKFRASDDGEPSGTSGIPILESIKNAGLTETAVVVVRYFGGIKLGTGGLARAYGDAASQGLSACGKVAFDKYRLLTIACDYALISAVQTQVYGVGGMILSSDYGDGALIFSAIPIGKKDGFLSALADATSGRAKVTEGEERYCEVK